jgi:hypothetical protein
MPSRRVGQGSASAVSEQVLLDLGITKVIVRGTTMGSSFEEGIRDDSTLAETFALIWLRPAFGQIR